MFNPAVDDEDCEGDDDDDDDEDDDTDSDTSDNARVDDFWLDVEGVKKALVHVAVDIGGMFRDEDEADSRSDERGSHAEEIPVLKVV
ncbi:hypothetical protein BGX34_004224 [Mortierella sp. NVP85]|nr:hypothetical protein BGX34_004224 [Mortierella sp. NVP85]